MNVSQPLLQPKRFSLQALADFLKKYWRAYLYLFLIAGIIVGFDQWMKALVRAHISLGSDWLPAGLNWLMPYARVRYWYNSGAAFGIFQNGNMVFTMLAIIVSLLILYYYPLTVREGWYLRLAMSMQFAGALGNLIDRLMFKHVTDFISVGNFAIFNIADASISVGVAVLVLGVWWKDRADKRRAMAASKSGEEVKGE
jgi:signal peptidase II